MKRRFLALGLASAICSSPASAQTTRDNLAKYTRLRARLVLDFTSVGPDQGQSQPAQERNEAQGVIRWSDSTIFLGWYIGLLATEYEIFSHPSQFPGADGGKPDAANATLDELYYALAALERLDDYADAAFPAPCTTTPALNGFFIRDDVPANFHERFPPLTVTRSDFVDPVLTNKEMSQDQVYHLYIGLALTKRLIPAEVTVKGKALREWAIEQSKRIGQHVSGGDWMIKNPACGNRNVNRGPDARGYSGGTRLAFGFATDGAFVPPANALLGGAFSLLTDPNSIVYNDPDNLHMAMAIAAVGNGWGSDTAKDLATLSLKEDWPAYPLLHRALYGAAAAGFCQTGADINARARQMLDELPQDAEPAAPPNGTRAVHGFTTTHRFVRPKAEAYVGSPGGEGLRYSGVDYLVLHNLYAIATPQTWGGDPNVAPCSVVVDAGATGDDGGPAAGGSGPGTGDTSDAAGGNGLSPPAAPSTSSGCGCTGVGQRANRTGALIALGIAAAALYRKRRAPAAAKVGGSCERS